MIGNRCDVNTVTEVLSHWARARGNSPAAIDPSVTVTFSELDEWSTAIASDFDARIAPGDRIAIWAENSARWAALAMAAAKLRAVVVPLNTRYRATELRHALSLTGVRHVFLDRRVQSNDLWATFTDVCLREDGTIDSDTFPYLAGYTELTDWHESTAACSMSKDRERALRAALPDDPYVVFFSSGSTGLPKAIAHTQQSIVTHARNIAEHQQLTHDDIGLVAPPLCGSFGFIILFELLGAGIPSALTSESSPEAIGAFVKKHHCTVANITDAYVNRIIFGGDSRPLQSIRKSAGGVFEVDPHDFVRRMDELRIPFTHAYGISEHQALAFLSSDTAPPGTRARPGGPAVTPGTEVRVVDAVSGQVLEPGQRGTLQIKSPVSMKGYLSVAAGGDVRYNNELSADSWLDTGDFAFIDTNGVVEYLGRQKDVFRLHGFLVSPLEIESALSAIPMVEICKTVGVESGTRTQVVAFLESQTDTPHDYAQEVIRQARRDIAGYKLPHIFVVIPRLPLIDASTGVKVDIRTLRQMAEQCLSDNHCFIAVRA